MTYSYVDELAAQFNAKLVFNEEAVKELARSNYIDYLNKETLYSCSNRFEQVCVMFTMRDNREITRLENKELQAKTKGYAISELQKRIAKLKVTTPIYDYITEAENQSIRITELEAKVAELQAEKRDALRAKNSVELLLRKREEQIKDLKSEVSILTTSLRQALLNNVVTKHAASVAGKVAKVATTKIVIKVG